MEANRSTRAPQLAVVHGSDEVESDQFPDRLLDAGQVAEAIGGVSPDWVRRNVPWKIDLGHSTKRWYRRDVNRWIESRREGDRRVFK